MDIETKLSPIRDRLLALDAELLTLATEIGALNTELTTKQTRLNMLVEQRFAAMIEAQREVYAVFQLPPAPDLQTMHRLASGIISKEQP